MSAEGRNRLWSHLKYSRCIPVKYSAYSLLINSGNKAKLKQSKAAVLPPQEPRNYGVIPNYLCELPILSRYLNMFFECQGNTDIGVSVVSLLHLIYDLEGDWGGLDQSSLRIQEMIY